VHPRRHPRRVRLPHESAHRPSPLDRRPAHRNRRPSSDFKNELTRGSRSTAGRVAGQAAAPGCNCAAQARPEHCGSVANLQRMWTYGTNSSANGNTELSKPKRRPDEPYIAILFRISTETTSGFGLDVVRDAIIGGKIRGRQFKALRKAPQLAEIGDAWVASGTSLGLRVPSAVSPEDANESVSRSMWCSIRGCCGDVAPSATRVVITESSTSDTVRSIPTCARAYAPTSERAPGGIQYR